MPEIRHEIISQLTSSFTHNLTVTYLPSLSLSDLISNETRTKQNFYFLYIAQRALYNTFKDQDDYFFRSGIAVSTNTPEYWFIFFQLPFFCSTGMFFTLTTGTCEIAFRTFWKLTTVPWGVASVLLGAGVLFLLLYLGERISPLPPIPNEPALLTPWPKFPPTPHLAPTDKSCPFMLTPIEPLLSRFPEATFERSPWMPIFMFPPSGRTSDFQNPPGFLPALICTWGASSTSRWPRVVGGGVVRSPVLIVVSFFSTVFGRAVVVTCAFFVLQDSEDVRVSLFYKGRRGAEKYVRTYDVEFCARPVPSSKPNKQTTVTSPMSTVGPLATPGLSLYPPQSRSPIGPIYLMGTHFSDKSTNALEDKLVRCLLRARAFKFRR